MEYNGQYLYPVRPASAQPEMFIPFYMRKNWIGQIKKNGTCSVIAVDPSGKLHAASRHHDDHKLWAPDEASSRGFQGLPGRGWYVFCAELLHSKTKDIKNTNYLFDLLVDDGDYLVGSTFEQRYDRLTRIFENRLDDRGDLSHYVIDQNLWLARNLDPLRYNLSAVFSNMHKPEDEGLVLKNPKTKLEFCLTERSNSAGMVKVRRPHKNFDY